MNGNNLDDVMAFLTVHEEKSFTSAGRLLSRDPSVISRRITALEARLGVRLIERSTRQLSTTEAGQLFYRRMRAAVSAMEEAEVEVTDASAAATGVLRLALPATFGRHMIVPHLPEFLQEWPNLRLELELSDRYVDMIEERFDLAVRIGELADSRLVARKLASNERILVASPGYIQQQSEPRTPADLSDHLCLVNSRFDGFLDWTLVSATDSNTVRVQSRMTSDDSDSLLTAAISGAGIMVCAKWLCADALRDGRLLRVLPDFHYGRSGSIYLVRPSARYTAAKTRRFADWIIAKLAMEPWQR